MVGGEVFATLLLCAGTHVRGGQVVGQSLCFHAYHFKQGKGGWMCIIGASSSHRNQETFLIIIIGAVVGHGLIIRLVVSRFWLLDSGFRPIVKHN